MWVRYVQTENSESWNCHLRQRQWHAVGGSCVTKTCVTIWLFTGLIHSNKKGKKIFKKSKGSVKGPPIIPRPRFSGDRWDVRPALGPVSSRLWASQHRCHSTACFPLSSGKVPGSWWAKSTKEKRSSNETIAKAIEDQMQKQRLGMLEIK